MGEWDWCWDENKIVIIIMWTPCRLNSKVRGYLKHRISEAAKRTPRPRKSRGSVTGMSM